MADKLYCSYCGSDQLVVYKVKYWKCLDCGRIVITPIIIPESTTAVETE